MIQIHGMDPKRLALADAQIRRDREGARLLRARQAKAGQTKERQQESERQMLERALAKEARPKLPPKKANLSTTVAELRMVVEALEHRVGVLSAELAGLKKNRGIEA